MTNKELLKLWANDTKRRAFIDTYKDWGEWFSVPELEMVFYKYDLPDGSKIIVAEHWAKNYCNVHGEDDRYLTTKTYLQTELYFDPSCAASDSRISEHLKDLKGKIQSGTL